MKILMIDDSNFKVSDVKEAVEYLNQRVGMSENSNSICENLLKKTIKHSEGSESYGFKLDVIQSCNAGLRALMENEYDLLILDWNIPRFEDSNIEPLGAEILRRVELYVRRGKMKDIPIIVYSSDVTSEMICDYKNIISLVKEYSLEAISLSIEGAFDYNNQKCLNIQIYD